VTSPLLAYLMQTTALDSVLKHLLPLLIRARHPTGIQIQIEQVARG